MCLCDKSCDKKKKLVGSTLLLTENLLDIFVYLLFAASRNRDHLDSSVGTSKPTAASRSSENPPSGTGFVHDSKGNSGPRLTEPSHRLGYSQQRQFVASSVGRTSNPQPRRIDLTQNTPSDALSNRGLFNCVSL